MKTLRNFIILYDAECPMCNLYTGAFTKTGMLERDGRAPYQEMPEEVCRLVDQRRAVDEIALVNKETGEVKYGIDSLFAVIGNSCPVFRPLFRFNLFAWVMRRLYAFISYNRKIIIPPAHPSKTALQPSFSLRNRIAYLIFTGVFVGFLLTRFTPLLAGLIPPGGPYREYLICGGQIFYQGGVLMILAPKKCWEYLGNMMTISFAGALLLTPVLVAASLTHIHPLCNAAYFMLVVGLMFMEHIRRSSLLGLGWVPTATWVLYRTVILGWILLTR